MVRSVKPLADRKEQTKQYNTAVRQRVKKIIHPKGWGTDKEHTKKGTWWEVRCDIHGTRTTEGKKVLTVAPPKGRFERTMRGCPVCRGGMR